MPSSIDQRIRLAPSKPDPADLAEVWLDHALSYLESAYEVEPERLDACRLAVVFAALAVETRLDRLLRGCGATIWPAVERLTPVEKLRVAPRLLGVLEPTPKHRPLVDAAVTLFELRGELVECAHAAESRHVYAATATTAVEVSAEICSFLATLAGEDEGTARYVHHQARMLRPRAAPVPEAEPGGTLGDWDEFPPDVIGS